MRMRKRQLGMSSKKDRYYGTNHNNKYWNGYSKGYYQSKGQWKGGYSKGYGQWQGMTPGRNFNCNAGNGLPNRRNGGFSSSSNQCPYPMLESRDSQFQKKAIVNDLTYDDLSELHALWLFERDDYDTTSPAFDIDGSLNEQSSGVNGVHFLTPNGESAACLTTAVSKDDVIFFDISASIFVSFTSDTEEDWYGPLRSYATFAGYPDPMSLSNEEVVLTAARLTSSFSQNLELNVFLDGCEINPRPEYAVSKIFRLSDTNSFGCGTFGAAGGYYGAVGPLSPGVHYLRIAVRNRGINFASDPEYYTTQGGDIDTYDSDNVFRLIVS